ncbi:MAG: hypothetical protein AB1806_01570 [Acidobacteriota bacterium]
MGSTKRAINQVRDVLGRLEQALVGADLDTLLQCERDFAAIVPEWRARTQAGVGAEGLSLRTDADETRSALARCRQLGSTFCDLTSLRLHAMTGETDYGRRGDQGRQPDPGHALEATA